MLPRRFRARVTADLSAPLTPPRILTLDIDLPDPKSYRIRELLKQHTHVFGFFELRDLGAEAGAGLGGGFGNGVAQR